MLAPPPFSPRASRSHARSVSLCTMESSLTLPAQGWAMSRVHRPQACIMLARVYHRLLPRRNGISLDRPGSPAPRDRGSRRSRCGCLRHPLRCQFRLMVCRALQALPANPLELRPLGQYSGADRGTCITDTQGESGLIDGSDG
jgi:hypothetical protein